MALDLNALYQYYREQGVDAQTAAQYAVYYIPAGKKKGFTGITTSKFKPDNELISEYAPNYKSYVELAAKKDPFWTSIIEEINKGTTYFDIRNKVFEAAEAQDADAEEIMPSVTKAFNEYTSYRKQVNKQKNTLKTYAASIGAPSPDLKYSFRIDPKSYAKETEVEYEPVRKVYNQLNKEIKNTLIKAKVPDAQIGKTLDEFDAAFETQIQAKLKDSNLSPFTAYNLRKG
jgi:hypothetical protein